MRSDAQRLHELAKAGEFAIDPHSANALARVYEDMVDEIDRITARVGTAERRLQLGGSPYAERVSAYQHETVDAFHDAAAQLRAACVLCAGTYREAAEHYVRVEQDAADAFHNARTQ
jgi:hypothetical protein